jgi:hypothetical protein
VVGAVGGVVRGPVMLRAAVGVLRAGALVCAGVAERAIGVSKESAVGGTCRGG